MLGDSQSALLIRFQRYLLREHNVARNEIAFRYEAPSLPRSAIAIEFDNIRAYTVLDAIFKPAITSDDLKVIVAIKLLPLLWRKPFAQENDPAGCPILKPLPPPASRGMHRANEEKYRAADKGRRGRWPNSHG